MSAAVEEKAAAVETVAPAENLYSALARAQGRFPRIEKNNTATVPGKDGKQGYSYSYADLGDVLAAVRPILAEEGLALVQRTVPDNGKTKLFTELLYGHTGEVLDSEIEIAAPTGNPQQFGGSLTYFRRYEAVTLLGVAAEEDLDAANVETVRNGASPSLPAWATALNQEKAKELFNQLEVLVGAEYARTLMGEVKQRTGLGIPAMFLPFAKAIADHYLDASSDQIEERREHARAVAAGDAEPTPAPVDPADSDVPPDMDGLPSGGGLFDDAESPVFAPGDNDQGGDGGD